MLFLIVPCVSYSQDTSEIYLYKSIYSNGNLKATIKEVDTLHQLVSYYKNGQIKDSLVRNGEVNVGIRKIYFKNGHLKNFIDYRTSDSDLKLINFIEFYENGQMKDSATLKDEVPIGLRKIFHKNGNIKLMVLYEKGEEKAFVSKYRKNGTLTKTGGVFNKAAFGEHRTYNRKGEVIGYKDLHKKNTVVVPYSYRKGRHLKEAEIYDRIEHSKVILYNDKQQTIIRSGALVSIETIKDSTILFHCHIEGFTKDSIIVSKFNYDLTDSEYFLEFNSTMVLGFNDINKIYFSRTNFRLAEYAAFTVTLTGIILVTHPILLPALISGLTAIIEPTGLIMLSSSIPVSLWGSYLNRKMIPKPYDLSEWKIKY